MNRLSFQCLGAASLVAFAAMSLGAAGCTSDLPIDGSGGGAAQTSTGTDATTGSNTTGGNTMTTAGSGGGGGGSDVDVINIAMLNSEITQVTDTDKSAWLDAGEKLDPTTLMVVVSDQLQSCNAPVLYSGPGPKAPDHHEVLIGLPQAMQKVGKYDFSSTDVIAFGSSWLGDGMGNGGGGNVVLTTGTIEILDFGAEAIQVRIEGLSGDFSLQNGDRWVVHCP